MSLSLQKEALCLKYQTYQSFIHILRYSNHYHRFVYAYISIYIYDKANTASLVYTLFSLTYNPKKMTTTTKPSTRQ